MIKQLTVFLLESYQKISRDFLGILSCRFYPSCSEYTKQAIIRYGVLFGCLMGLKRLLLCHPFSGKSGYDPLK